MVPEVSNRFHVPHMFRTCSAHRVPHMLRTSRIAILTKKTAPVGCQWQTKGFKYQKFLNFKKCLHFSISKTRILKIVISTISTRPKIQILIIDAYLIWNLGDVFRTCSVQFQLEQCSMFYMFLFMLLSLWVAPASHKGSKVEFLESLWAGTRAGIACC